MVELLILELHGLVSRSVAMSEKKRMNEKINGLRLKKKRKKKKKKKKRQMMLSFLP